MSQKKIQTDEYVVAFIDILGASEMIKKDADGSLRRIHKIYDKARRMYKKFTDYPNAGKEFLTIRIFSDNIVIAAPTSKEGSLPALAVITSFCRILQKSLHTQKY